MTDIAAFSQPGRFWRGNLHTHSTLSDGALPPDQGHRGLSERRLRFPLLSEHFLERFDWPIADTRHMRSNRFTTLIGPSCMPPRPRWASSGTSSAPACRSISSLAAKTRPAPPSRAAPPPAGGFIGIAHPSWSQLTIADGEAIDVAHAVEIYNHGCAVENDRGEGWYLLDQLLNQGRRLNAFATDDAHFHHGDFDAFGGWVHVKAESLDPDAILEALKAGHYYSSQGPRIHELSVSGKEVTITCSPVNAITIMGGTSRTVTGSAAISPAALRPRQALRTWLPGGETAWLRVAIMTPPAGAPGPIPSGATRSDTIGSTISTRSSPSCTWTTASSPRRRSG